MAIRIKFDEREQWLLSFISLHTITGFTLQEACDINLKICIAVWGAYSGRTWQEVQEFRYKQRISRLNETY